MRDMKQTREMRSIDSPTKKIGITGGIACGKSTVLSICKNAGHSVFSCDEIAHELFVTSAVQDFIHQWLYKSDRPEDTTYSRLQVRGMILTDPIFKREYEKFFHPLIRDAMWDSYAEICEVPLLYEIGMESLFQHIWVIAIEPEEQIRRIVEVRGLSKGEALAMINTQKPMQEKISRADRVLWTNKPIDILTQETLQFLSEDLV